MHGTGADQKEQRGRKHFALPRSVQAGGGRVVAIGLRNCSQDVGEEVGGLQQPSTLKAEARSIVRQR